MDDLLYRRTHELPLGNSPALRYRLGSYTRGSPMISNRYYSWVEALAKKDPVHCVVRSKACLMPHDAMDGSLMPILVTKFMGFLVSFHNMWRNNHWPQQIRCGGAHRRDRAFALNHLKDECCLLVFTTLCVKSIQRLHSWAPHWSNPLQWEPLGYYNLNFSLQVLPSPPMHSLSGARNS